jgi:hypothetical protein
MQDGCGIVRGWFRLREGGHTFISIWPQKIIIRPCTGVFFNKGFLHIHVFFLHIKGILQIKILYTIHSLLANVKFICPSVRNKENSEMSYFAASTNKLCISRQCTNIVFILQRLLCKKNSLYVKTAKQLTFH